jgi:hypothetical protein
MSSFTFSFRTIALALGLVAVVEGACALVLRPGFVDRANFGSLERFQRAVIFGKLRDFDRASPDIIQVGDSSGFLGVRPDIVMSYLDGLTYLNLSCCANTGYRGYYGIADFMLRRNPGIKAVVLYVSLNNLPRADLIEGQRQIGESIQKSLNTPFAYLSPPTLALRQMIADAFDRPSRTDAVFTPEMRRSVREHNGWWAEHDRRLTGEKRTDYWRQACGETGVAVRSDHDRFYGDDFVHGRQSHTRTELQRFAQLAADHGAKLVVIFHPFSCRGLEGSLLAARREDVRAVAKQYDNMVALPDQMLELWPTGKFVGADHLRVGYDEENSRRVGRLLAAYLGIPRAGGAPAATDAAAMTAESAPGGARSAAVTWRFDGAVVTADDAPADMAGSRLLIEGTGRGLHRVEGTLTDVKPGATTVLSFPARPIGTRGILVELRAGGRQGRGYCDLAGGTAQREGEMLDVGLDAQPNGWSRCWVAMVLGEPTATLRLSLVDEHLEPSYVGDDRSGVAIGEVELRETAHFLHREGSPW